MDSLNSDITYQEVHDAVYRAKLRKAAGFDGISSEVLRNDICIELLYKIINYCFKHGEVPSEWTRGIIILAHQTEIATLFAWVIKLHLTQVF